MLVLPVAAFRGNQIPAIGFDHFDDVAYLHTQILAHIAIFGGVPAQVVKVPFYEPEWKMKKPVINPKGRKARKDS